MIDRLRKQEQIGKATFQFTFHSTTTWKQRNKTSSKLKPTTLTFCRWKSLACLPDSFLPCSRCPVVPGQLCNKAERQSSKHPPFAEPTQHMHVFGGKREHYQKLYARVTHIWGNRKGQPDPSAMKEPRLERTASLITVPPASGKFFCI